MPINRLYRSLRDLLVQLRPNERETRVRNFSWLLAGLFLSRSVHLSKIANKIPAAKATLPSVVRRLSRLVDNAAPSASGSGTSRSQGACWSARPGSWARSA
jgi:hypothetical protein